jgi:hypothetical protein
VDNKLDLSAPIFDDFREDLEDVIASLLSNLVHKKAFAGSVTAKLAITLEAQPMTAPDTGELIEEFIPRIDHKITAKISMDAGEAKGSYVMQNIVISKAGDSWIFDELYDPGPSLFDEPDNE